METSLCQVQIAQEHMDDAILLCQMSLEGDCASGYNVELRVNLTGSFQGFADGQQFQRSKVGLGFTVCKTGALPLSLTHCVIEKEAHKSWLIFPF